MVSLELAVMVALKESLYDPDYGQEETVAMLRKLGEQTKWLEHRRLVDNIVAGCHDAEPVGYGAGEGGVRFPVLPDADGAGVDLAALMQGKWVYLSFVRVGDPNCLREIETLAHFKDSVYGKNPDVLFVSVSCDREFQKMFHFLRNNRRGPRYSWTWLHFDGNWRWLEEMGAVSYPTFLLFDPEGYQPYTVTPWPESGILLHGPWEKRVIEHESPEFLR